MNVEEGRDLQGLVEEAARGLERPVRYQGFEPREPNGDYRLEVLISEVPHEIVLARGLVRSDRSGDLTNQGPQEPAEPTRAAWGSPESMRDSLREALVLMMRENWTAVRLSENGIQPLDHRVAAVEHRAA